jgi:hypothetical protein
MLEILRNGYGWVTKEVGRELLRLIFPKYPDVGESHPLPQWVKEKLEENKDGDSH